MAQIIYMLASYSKVSGSTPADFIADLWCANATEAGFYPSSFSFSLLIITKSLLCTHTSPRLRCATALTRQHIITSSAINLGHKPSFWSSPWLVTEKEVKFYFLI